MVHGETSQRIIFCPTLQDYNEAVQTPSANLRDNQLKIGMPYTDAMGLPRPITGSFASVYRMHCADSDFALRLFLRNIQDQSSRYSLISESLKRHALACCVSFEFLDEGIKTHGVWVPALKMKWVEGKTLDAYVVENVMDSRKLGRFLDGFVAVTKDLRSAGIAHGDLQHGNIMICSDQIKLVDYDGMFVPAMKGLPSTEIGHPNYQHPARQARHFGPHLDNFSAWVIKSAVKPCPSGRGYEARARQRSVRGLLLQNILFDNRDGRTTTGGSEIAGGPENATPISIS